MEPVTAEMLFVIPDIGGYTNFMIAHQEAPEYAQKVIRQLMDAMLKEKEIPLRISSVEGTLFFCTHLKKMAQSGKRRKIPSPTQSKTFLSRFMPKHGDLWEKSSAVAMHASILSRLASK